jgi:small subunit ribosomal protein S7e
MPKGANRQKVKGGKKSKKPLKNQPKNQPKNQRKNQPKSPSKSRSQAKSQPKGRKNKNASKGGKQKVRQGQKKKQKVSDSNARKRSKAANAERMRTQRRLNLIIRSKFQNPSKATPPTPLEIKICEYLVDLEAGSKDLKEHLRDLGIVNARQIVVDRRTTKTAIVIFVPVSQHKRWQKLQDRVQTELEKKFSGIDIVFIANRKVMKLNQIKNNVPRPRTQTITAVHQQMLKDVVFPTKIVGKRTRFRVGGTRLLKVYLEPKDTKEIEARIPTYEAVYRKLTKKNVRFLFPRYVI